MLRSYRDPINHDIIIHRLTERATIDDICDVFDREERLPFMTLKAIWDYRSAVLDFPHQVSRMDVFAEFEERLKRLRAGSVAALVCAHDLQARALQNLLDELTVESELRVFTNWNEAHGWLSEQPGSA